MKRILPYSTGAYLSMLERAGAFELPNLVDKRKYLAAIQTLENELKALRLEMEKDLVRAKAATQKEGSSKKRRTLLKAEVIRAQAALAAANNRLARLKLDKTEVFAVWNAEVKDTALVVLGSARFFGQALAKQNVHNIVVPVSILQSLEHWQQIGVPADDAVLIRPKPSARVKALRELQLTIQSLEEWFHDIEIVLAKL